ncbi:Uncharacterised protein [Clostridioides difficile]|nr:Uncharacterised protein [Clostridioides difficile]SJW90658.1 Uncharacterised protein [Clostridioides difficile]SJX07781.1 Uncharacterised protein [Clostridioides difficile]
MLLSGYIEIARLEAVPDVFYIWDYLGLGLIKKLYNVKIFKK